MTPEEVFEDYLDREGLRMTAQRGAILDFFLKKEGHFTAEELYRAVKRKDKRIGLATVYRNLRLLVGSGLASEHDFGRGAVFYEHKYDHGHHDHIICTSCGERTEVYDERIEKLQKYISRKHGALMTGHKLYLYVVCAKCRNK